MGIASKSVIIVLTVPLAISSCKPTTEQIKPERLTTQPTFSKIPVLNFATFHMGGTSDANSAEFDENNRKNQEDAREIASMLAEFKPTIVCVEVPLDRNAALDSVFQAYLQNGNPSTYYGEVGMVAFEIAKISQLERLYGIDHKMDYNYMIGEEIDNTIDPVTYQEYTENPFKTTPGIAINEDSLSLLDRLKLMNQPEYLNFLIEINADILTHVGTENNFEGADEAAKYYQRNLRMYSNLNRIPKDSTDRIFLIMGGSHTAFFNDFMRRSPKYELVDVFEYLP